MKVHEKHKAMAHQDLNIALIVVSTTRYHEAVEGKESTDKTISLVEELVAPFPNILLELAEIIPDEEEQIKDMLKVTQTEKIDCVIFSGGTGLTPKDFTYETIQPLFEKELPGFGELFRQLSYEEIGSSAMLSRATAGKIDRRAVFLLPGSPNAVKLALNKLILPELPHMVAMIRKEE
ncbi:MAG: Molybdenum cofactor biosynthesis protein B [Promethearchaeota archaeon]|nr:MAG: Molybdenum cofactor biosynthesis protein B [Candidatus Lokiarchaeota archaeon]